MKKKTKVIILIGAALVIAGISIGAVNMSLSNAMAEQTGESQTEVEQPEQNVGPSASPASKATSAAATPTSTSSPTPSVKPTTTVKPTVTSKPEPGASGGSTQGGVSSTENSGTGRGSGNGTGNTNPAPPASAAPAPAPATPAPAPTPAPTPTPQPAEPPMQGGYAYCSCGAKLSENEVSGHMKQHAMNEPDIDYWYDTY